MFAIAGLFKETLRENATDSGIGELPVLGALFRSNDFQKNESELVIIVTPHLVKPLNMAKQTLPTDGFQEPDDFEFYLLGRLTGRDSKSPRETLPRPKVADDPQAPQTPGSTASSGTSCPSEEHDHADPHPDLVSILGFLALASGCAWRNSRNPWVSPCVRPCSPSAWSPSRPTTPRWGPGRGEGQGRLGRLPQAAGANSGIGQKESNVLNLQVAAVRPEQEVDRDIGGSA